VVRKLARVVAGLDRERDACIVQGLCVREEEVDDRPALRSEDRPRMTGMLRFYASSTRDVLRARESPSVGTVRESQRGLMSRAAARA
jgi:hypothetical protein